MANSSPCSVLNELAKSNKVSAHYQVVSESGPPHLKLYTIHLHIGGNGPFEGLGSSLKNARNAAASRALIEGAPGLDINPTVELNIMSMKSGEQAIYRELDSVSLPPRPDYESLFIQQQYGAGMLQRQPRMPPRIRKLWRMSVTICGRTYVGEGHTKSEARGNSASHALLELKPLLIERAKVMEIERAQQQQATPIPGGTTVGKVGSITFMNLPSYVSSLYELANKYSIDVNFETTDEGGPPHVKHFRVKCKVGEKEVSGTGVGKKAAKNDAAQKMLVLLKDLPPLPEGKKKGKYGRQRQVRSKSKFENGIDPSLDAVTYLTHLVQLRKEPAPTYNLILDAGLQQKPAQYEIEAAIGEHKASGYGETKKLAKVNAATNLLKTLDIDLVELRETYGVPEIDILKDGADFLSLALNALKQPEVSTVNRAPGTFVTSKITVKQADFNQQFTSAKQKLEHIARLEGFQVLFNDFLSKDSHDSSELTTHLTIFSSPPEVFRGVGITVEQSRENAAKKALEAMTVLEPGA